MGRAVRLLLMLVSIAVLLAGLVRGAGDSAISKAVKAGDVTAVRKLIAARADVNERLGDGSTPLLWASHKSDVDMVRILVEAGAKPDIPNNYGVTPLLDASRSGDVDMVELLLKAGADPKRAHPEGETPLMAASRAGSLPIVRLLLDRGADANAADSFQKETGVDVGLRRGPSRCRRRAAQRRRQPQSSGAYHVHYRPKERGPSDRWFHGADVGCAQRI
jgi:hypothetical protein